ncbi:MAG TPA: ABC transporter ATP-binding protein [Aeromicrobium sp.]|nr:ABC transporter ATP-binding protein [Aeromicrobium sp.]
MIEFCRASVVVDTPDGDLTLLEPLTISLGERRIGIIGANGSGKSTLARMVNGLIEPTSGRVLVDGRDVVDEGREVRRRVGFVFTNPDSQLVMPTVIEDVMLSLRRVEKNKSARRRRALEVLETIGLAQKADVAVHALSGGQKQLLALAGVLAVEPDVVVADEPTTLLDLQNTVAVADKLFSMRQQLLLVSHDLSLMDRCDRVLVVDSARVVFDGTAVGAVEHYRELSVRR